MKRGILKKEDVKKFVEVLGEKYSFYGPVRNDDGVSLSEPGPGEDITFEYSNFKLSPKELFFPQTEDLYTLSDSTAEGISPPEKKFVVFGIRPCDTLALLHIDEVYRGLTPEDPYYLRRRENAVIIPLACIDPQRTCFCTSVGEGPAGNAGADAMAFDLGDSLLLETCTEIGRECLDVCSDLLQEPDETAIKHKEEQVSSAREKVTALDSGGITENLQKKFESPIWDEISQRCLSCGACTYLCPTCHCFGIYDKTSKSGNGRMRCWDACMIKEFNLEASGHNPRGTNGQRLRQRIMHKFRYTVENFEKIFCVGCGRCVNHCPVNIDVREIITEVIQ